MKDAGAIEPNAEQHEALQAFELLVKAQLPVALQASSGNLGLSYRYLVLMAMPYFLYYVFDHSASFIVAGEGIRKIIIVAIDGITN